MSIELATAYVNLVPSMQGSQAAIASAITPAAEAAGADAGKRMGASMSTGLKTLIGAGAFTAVIGGAVQFARDSMESLARIETINTQTASVIASTGGAANVSAKQVEDLALALEATTATEAESIQEGANLLLTFKNIQNAAGEGNDIFDQSVTAMTDMSRAMGTDASAGAIQLGKALNDPVAGLSALARVGVQFTDEQKAMIESMVAAGDTAGAQKIILGELNDQFGGSGAAYAQTYAGQMDLLKDSVGDLGQSVMTGLMPHLLKLAEIGTTAFGWLTENQGAFIAIASVIGVTLVAAFIAWTASIWMSTVALLANPVTWIVIGIMALVAALILLVANWDTVVAWLKTVWGSTVTWVKDLFASIGAWFTTKGQEIAAFLSGLWTSIKTTATNVWNGIVSWVQQIPQRILAFFLNWTLPGLLIKHWSSIKEGAVRGFTAVVDFVGGIPGRIVSALGNLGQLLLGAGENILGGFLRGLRNGFDAVKDFVGGIGSWIADNKGPKAYDLALLRPAGKWIMTGFRMSIEDEIPDLRHTMDRVTAAVQVGGAIHASASGAPAGAAVAGPTINVTADPRYAERQAQLIVTRMRDMNVRYGLAGAAL